MNREIKFRYTYKRKSDGHLYQVIYSIESIERGSESFTSMLHNELWEVVAKDQFTGLKDKDNNDIYEGDILSFDGNLTADDSFGTDPNGYIYDEDSKHEVIWNAEQACWDLKHDEDTHWKYKRDTHGLMLDNTAIEIIGNIYEHPHLIQK